MSYLPLLCLNQQFYLVVNIITKQMENRWAPHQDQLLPIFLSVIMNKFGSKIFLLNLNLSFIKGMLITLSCYFDFDVTLLANILMLSFLLRQKKKIHYCFLILKLRVNNSFSTSIYRKVTFSEFFTGASPRKFLWWWLCKSWTSYPGQYSDLSECATKTKQLKVSGLIMNECTVLSKTSRRYMPISW